MAAVQRFIAEKGGLFSINHPKSIGPPWLFTGWEGFQSMEVWQAMWRFYNWESLERWDNLLQRGERIVAVGGPDTPPIPPAEPRPKVGCRHPGKSPSPASTSLQHDRPRRRQAHPGGLALAREAGSQAERHHCRCYTEAGMQTSGRLSTIAERVEAVRLRIASACRRSGRSSDGVSANETDKLSQTYIERCDHLKAHPPDDWDAILIMTGK